MPKTLWSDTEALWPRNWLVIKTLPSHGRILNKTLFSHWCILPKTQCPDTEVLWPRNCQVIEVLKYNVQDTLISQPNIIPKAHYPVTGKCIMPKTPCSASEVPAQDTAQSINYNACDTLLSHLHTIPFQVSLSVIMSMPLCPSHQSILPKILCPVTEV